MSEERGKRERTHLQHEAEHARPRKKVSVVSYLAILFGAAFLLLLLSYFMQQRSSEEAISGLKDSVTSMQSVGNLVEQNTALQEQATALEEEAAALEEQVQAAEAQNKELHTTITNQGKTLEAMDWFWRIQRAYSRGAKAEASTLVAAFEATLLTVYLPTASPAQAEGPSPAEQYQALLDALDYRKAEP